MSAQSTSDVTRNAAAALHRGRGDDAPPVLIVGGGIGGMAAALSLARRGIASHVLERRSIFSEEGAGIQIGPNGTLVLQQLGIADALRPLVGTPQALSVRDGSSGDELTRLPLGEWMTMRYGSPYWVAHRKDLHGVLEQAVRADPLITLTMDFSATNVVCDAARATVTAHDGRSYTGRALVAADGIFSQLRSNEFAGREPRFCGKTAARCVIPAAALPAQLKRQETTIWLFPNAHVVHYPVSGGAELAVVVVIDSSADSTGWNVPVSASLIAQAMPPCAEILRTLLAEGDTWRSWALRTVRTPRSFARGRMALLGDAAHPILPFLAQGAVMALEDASVLAAALDSHSEVAAALRFYERRRWRRVNKVARASRQNGRIYHMSGMQAAARNMVLRRSPPERLMEKYDWLYGWRNE